MLAYTVEDSAAAAHDIQQEDDKPFQVRLSDEAFETYEMDPPSYTLDTTKNELKQMYYDMVAVRYVRLEMGECGRAY